jgi:hypothetical protein
MNYEFQWHITVLQMPYCCLYNTVGYAYLIVKLVFILVNVWIEQEPIFPMVPWWYEIRVHMVLLYLAGNYNIKHNILVKSSLYPGVGLGLLLEL